MNNIFGYIVLPFQWVWMLVALSVNNGYFIRIVAKGSPCIVGRVQYYGIKVFFVKKVFVWLVYGGVFYFFA